MSSKAKKPRIFIVITLIAIIVAGIVFFSLFEPGINLFGFCPLDEAKLVDISRTITVSGPEKDDSGIFYGDDKIFCPIESLSDNTLNAFIAIEDKRFYRHHGVDYARILAAIKNNILSGRAKEGASTITQQLVKNTHLSNEKTLFRKINEIRIAREVEKKYSKREILENYLNVIYFGNNIYGIGAAAKRYFAKDASMLTLSESALLAGIINSPANYDPLCHMERAVYRRNLTLKCMLQQKMIDTSAYNAALAETPAIATDGNCPDVFVSKAIREAKQELNIGKNTLFAGHYTICSQRDKKLSDMCLQIINSRRIDGTFTEVIVADNTSGACIANVSNSPIDASNLRRMPGSIIKPFVCYAPAIEKKLVYTATPVLDEKIDFSGYSPENYDKKYHGWVSVSESLIHSYNIPAVKLLHDNGVNYSINVAKKFGLEFDSSDKSLALALGAMKNGVTLAAIAESYMTLARGGIHAKLYFNSAIFDNKGQCVYSHNGSNDRAVGDDTAFLITDMLTKCAKEGTAKRMHGCTPGQIAAKTGTVGNKNGNTDAYCVAYSPEYTVAVRISALGDNLMSNEISGGTEPTSIAAEIMRVLSPSAHFEVPASVVSIDINAKELRRHQKIIPAGSECPERDKISVFFSRSNMPYAYDLWFSGMLDNFDKFDVFDAFID